MLSAFGHMIFRERRRLIFVTVMAFLAGFFFYLNSELSIGGVHIAIVTGTIYAVVVGFAALLVCLFLPSMRFMIEAIAVSRLGLSFFVLAAPEVGAQILASPMMTAFLVVLGGAFVSRVLHGRFERDHSYGIRNRILPKNIFRRDPPRVAASSLQYRFMTWMDDAAPVRI